MQLQVTDLLAVPRDGLLLREREDEIKKLASEAELSCGEPRIVSASRALARLLWKGHEHACLLVEEPALAATMPCFRGQAATYDKVQTGTSVAGNENPFLSRISWFGVLLCAWLEARIPIPKGAGTFALSWEERLYVAQHYYEALGIRTPLLDWTFDPVIAFSFATLNPKARVLVDYRGLNDRTYLTLPPLNIPRPWVQKAAHGWNTDYPVTALENIVFAVEENERQATEDIRRRLFPADSIIEIARIAVSQENVECPRNLISVPRFEFLKEFSVELAQQVEGISPTPVSSDWFFDYVNCVGLRRRGRGKVYDKLALCGVFSNSFWVGDILSDEQETRSRVLYPIWRDHRHICLELETYGRYVQV